MDPNESLVRIRIVASRIFSGAQMPAHLLANDAVALGELVEALDDWLSHGGALPEEWSR